MTCRIPFSKGSLPVKSLVEAVNIDPTYLKSDTLASTRLSLRMRVPLALARFLISLCIGVAATVGWRSSLARSLTLAG